MNGVEFVHASREFVHFAFCEEKGCQNSSFFEKLGFLTDGLRRPHVSLQLQFYHNTVLGMGSSNNFFLGGGVGEGKIRTVFM